MSWKQVNIDPKILEGLDEVSSAASSIVSAVSPVLDSVSSALNVAKVFFKGSNSPLQSIGVALIDEIQNLVDDTFNTGVYHLFVNPYDLPIEPNKFGFKLLNQDPSSDGTDIGLPIEKTIGVNSYDDFGNPKIKPSKMLRIITQSFYDQGDPERPLFSDDASVAAVGFMITAPDIDGFRDSIKAFQDFFGLPFLDDLQERLEEKMDRLEGDLTSYGGNPPHRHEYFANSNLSGSTKKGSIEAYNEGEKIEPHDHVIINGVMQETLGHTHKLYTPKAKEPNWSNQKIQDYVTILNDQYASLTSMLQYLKGLLITADDSIDDLIRTLERKLNTLRGLIEDINDVIQTITNLTRLSGVYLFDVPVGTGGVSRIVSEMNSPELKKLKNSYSIAYIIVGGGPSAQTVENIRILLGGS